MGLTERLEKHIVIVIATVAIISFIAGWGSYYGVQKAASLVPISKDKIESLEQKAQLGKEEYIQQVKLLESKISEMNDTEANLRARLLKNRPTNSTYIENIQLLPESPAQLSVKDKITVSFDYVIEEGLEAYIWIDGGGDATTSSGSSILSGEGTTSHWLNRSIVGSIEDITLKVKTIQREVLYTITIPVKYNFISK